MHLKEIIVRTNIHTYPVGKNCKVAIDANKLTMFNRGVGAPKLNRCSECFSAEFINTKSYNVNAKCWHGTNNRTMRNNHRCIKKGDKFEDTNLKEWIYLGNHFTYDARKNMWLDGYLIKHADEEKGDYIFVKELKVRKIVGHTDLGTNVEEIKQAIKKKCKTYEDYIKYGLVLNVSTEKGYIDPYFMRK